MGTAQVFISSSFADRKFAGKLEEQLRRDGLGAASAPAELGQNAAIPYVSAAIRAADLIVVVVSPNGPDDAQQAVWPEVLAAVWSDPSKRILPLLLRSAPVPPFVNSTSRALRAISLADLAEPLQIKEASVMVTAAARSIAREAALADRRGTSGGEMSRDHQRGARRDDPGSPYADGGSVNPSPPQRGDRMGEIERFVEHLKPPRR